MKSPCELEKVYVKSGLTELISKFNEHISGSFGILKHILLIFSAYHRAYFALFSSIKTSIDRNEVSSCQQMFRFVFGFNEPIEMFMLEIS